MPITTAVTSINLPTTLLDKIKSSVTTLGDKLILEAEIAGRLEASLKHDESLKIIRDSIPGEIMTFVPKWTPTTGMYVMIKQEYQSELYSQFNQLDGLNLDNPHVIVGISTVLDDIRLNIRSVDGVNFLVLPSTATPWVLDAE